MTRLIKIRLKRRREGKTDYKSRLALLKSHAERLVVRKTNKYIIAQIVKSREAQDFTIVYANSKELSKHGWSFSFKNVPCAYLTGLLLGKKAKENKKIKELILDLGLSCSTKGSRIYSVVKGVIDSGIKVKCNEEMLPKEDRIYGKHIQKGELIRKVEEIKNKILKSL